MICASERSILSHSHEEGFRDARIDQQREPCQHEHHQNRSSSSLRFQEQAYKYPPTPRHNFENIRSKVDGSRRKVMAATAVLGRQMMEFFFIFQVMEMLIDEHAAEVGTKSIRISRRLQQEGTQHPIQLVFHRQ